MPGLSFICDFKEDISKKESIILQSLDSLIHFEEYKRKTLLKEKFYFLAYTKYKEYPIISFDNRKYCIYLEGKIYGKDYQTIKSELNELAELIFQNQTNTNKQISDWLLNTDGDFIIFVFNKQSNEIAILNDALGRLPLYYYKSRDILLVSRELRFITNILNDYKFDKMAIAQFLLFGYSLGEKTLLENIYRVKPATLITANAQESEFSINVYKYNFEIKKYFDRSIEKNASNLVSLFSKACKNRANSNNKNILSLSGGLDSRAVAAGLYKNNIPFYGTTFLDYNKTNKVDIRIVKQLAELFNIDLKLFDLVPTKGKDLHKLLRIKNGLNWLVISYYIQFLNKIKETNISNVIFLTGDGGDKLLPYIRPTVKLESVNGLVNYIIFKNKIFPLDVVSTLTQIPKSEILTELKNHFLSYPEQELSQKYVHFLVFERAFKWLFEGEDRNRFYFWSVTPFYSIQFFNYAMNCPDKQKSKYKLYHQFLRKLSSGAVEIDYAYLRAPITNYIGKIKLIIKDFVIKYPKLEKEVKRVYFSKHKISYNDNSNFIKCLKKQTKNCNQIFMYLSHQELNNIIRSCNKYTKLEIENLFTITSTIEELECGKSTLEEYYNSDFM